MKVALVQCPAWSVDRPPYGISILTSLLRGHGHEVYPFDFNVEMFRAAKRGNKLIRFMLSGVAENKFTAESWSAWAIEWDWGNRNDVKTYIKQNRKLINRFITDILETDADVIGFSVHYTSQHFSEIFSKMLKKRAPNKIILFGGPQCFPTAEGPHMMIKNPHLDICCLGEAEGLLGQLIDDIEEHGLTDASVYEPYKGYQIRLEDGHIVHGDSQAQPNWINLDDLPMADWTWVDYNKYTNKSIPVITSRGCIRRCHFCSEAGAKVTSWGAYRYRSAEKIMEEIKYQYDLYKFNFLWFTDSVFNGQLKMIDKLMDLLIEADLDFKWDAQLTIRKDMTQDLLNRFKKAGCNMIHWGLESGSDAVLKFMNKGYKAEAAKVIIERTYNAGIKQNINLIVGYPGETEEYFQESIQFLHDVMPFGIENPPVAPCDINRGSTLFEKLDELDIDLGEEYGHWYIRDGSNTYEIRMDRKKRMEEALLAITQGKDYKAKRQFHNVIAE